MSDGLETNVSNRKSLSTGQVVGFGLLILIFGLFIQLLVLLGLIIFQSISGSAPMVEEISGGGFYLALAPLLAGLSVWL